MRQTTVSLQALTAQYRMLISRMEQSEAAIARQDLDAVEACLHGTDQALAELAQSSAQCEGLAIAPGEEPAWNGLADAMRQAFTRAEQNRAQIQRWIGQTHDVLLQMSKGGRAVNGYATTGTPDGAEFLSARG
jgi:ABC-type Fe2+-enterobactin transport system substrate-binding protein